MSYIGDGYGNPSFSKLIGTAKALGQVALTQSVETQSHSHNGFIAKADEIFGGIHYVEYKSLLLRDDIPDGIYSSLRREGMPVYVAKNDDGTALQKIFYLINAPGTSGFGDWLEIGTGNFSFSGQVYQVPDLAARDALEITPGVVEGDVANVVDARTTAEKQAGFEETQITTIADVNGSLDGTYFHINSANDDTQYYVWFSVPGADTTEVVEVDFDPTGADGQELDGATIENIIDNFGGFCIFNLGGPTAIPTDHTTVFFTMPDGAGTKGTNPSGAPREIEVAVTSGMTSAQVAAQVQAAVNADAKFSASVASEVVTITYGTAGDISGRDVGNANSDGGSNLSYNVTTTGATGVGAPDPTLAGKVGIQVTLAEDDVADVVAQKIETALAGASGDFSVSRTNNVLTITNQVSGATTDAYDGNGFGSNETGFAINVTNDATEVAAYTLSYIWDGSQWLNIYSPGQNAVASDPNIALNTAARHQQNTDTKLNEGGPNETTAAEIRAHIDDDDIHFMIDDTDVDDLLSVDDPNDIYNLDPNTFDSTSVISGKAAAELAKETAKEAREYTYSQAQIDAKIVPQLGVFDTKANIHVRTDIQTGQRWVDEVNKRVYAFTGTTGQSEDVDGNGLVGDDPDTWDLWTYLFDIDDFEVAANLDFSTLTPSDTKAPTVKYLHDMIHEFRQKWVMYNVWTTSTPTVTVNGATQAATLSVGLMLGSSFTGNAFSEMSYTISSQNIPNGQGLALGYNPNDANDKSIAVGAITEGIYTLDGKVYVPVLYNYNGTLYSPYPSLFNDISGLSPGSGGSGSDGIFSPVQDITALKALDTSLAADWPDKWIINVEDEGIYQLDRDSSDAEDQPEIIAPTTGVGRWKLVTASPFLVQNALRSGVDGITTFGGSRILADTTDGSNQSYVDIIPSEIFVISIDSAGNAGYVQTHGNAVQISAVDAVAGTATINVKKEGDVEIDQGKIYVAEKATIVITGASQTIDFRLTSNHPVIDFAAHNGAVTIDFINGADGQSGFIRLIKGVNSVTPTFEYEGDAADFLVGDGSPFDPSELTNDQDQLMGYFISGGQMRITGLSPIYN